MQIDNIEKQAISVDKARQAIGSGSSDFSLTLKNQQTFNEQFSQKIDTFPTSIHPTTTLPEPGIIKLGTLSGNNKTVAQLLLANQALKSSTWSIIHNQVNKNKAFHQISAGKEIFYNQQTQELQWSESKNTNIQNSQRQKNIFSTTSLPSFTTEAKQKIILGEVNQDNPTISNLLSQQSDYKAQRWDIIHSDVNKHKPFTKIPNGTTIYIDNKTKELSWNRSTPASASASEHKESIVSHIDNQVDKNKILAKKLDDAVKPFMGTQYKHLDCYTLVVNGLENMGIRYRGKGNISAQLLQRAQLDGRASHAYFTGEGLTEALGDKIYTRAITQVNNIDQQSQAVFQEMQDLMKKGDILSFSLQTKGHTGVISQNKKQWTYINSGRMDHSITSNAPRHGVGEESLLSEINNWIKLAQQRKESLQITVGRIDKQKFA